MCGIAGFWDLRVAMEDNVAQKTIDAMTDTLIHRGPDDRGTWRDRELGLALGHRRLSIVDLSSAGHQPMTSKDGRYVIVYNGEVYSAVEIRADLEGMGYRFRGHSDTEAILEGFAAWGIEATLKRLIGMFAMAVWDRAERRLSLIRDRLGIKPLYWGLFGNVLLFGSELKTLRVHPGCIAEIDRGSLKAFLEFSFIPAPASIYRGIQKLAQGQVLEIASGGKIQSRAFWSLDDACRQVAGKIELDDIQAEQELHTLLVDVVGRRMIADVPLGAFLSGGVDSSTVVALMQNQSSTRIKTFSIGFSKSELDEATYARQVAKHLGTEHSELYVDAELALATIPEMPLFFDEPFGDASQIPTYLISTLARSQVNVALSGDGGDELFAGYSRYLAVDRLWHGRIPIPSGVRRLAANFLLNVPEAYWERMMGILPASKRISRISEKISKLASILPLDDVGEMHRQLLNRWIGGQEAVIGGDPMRSFSVPSQLPARLNKVESMQLLDMLTYLPDDVLTKVDRASMAVGLEVRVPLLDHRLVEFALKLPYRTKVRNAQSKWLFRKILARYVPRTLTDRPKMGFSVPIGEWLRGPLRDWAEDLLSVSRLARDGYMRPDVVRKMWDEHLSGRFNWQDELWNALMFQAWLQRNGP